jgi:hypothetical protein
MLFVNGISNTGWINDANMKMVSVEFENLFTPAGYAFSIWGLIYLALSAFLFHIISKAIKKEPSLASDKTLKLFTAINLVNTVWIVLWLYYLPGWALLLMGLLLILLIAVLVEQRMCLDDASLKSFVFVQWPFSLYLGWIIAASIANTSAFLTSLNWNGGPFSETAWTLIMISAAVLIYLYMVVKRNTRLLSLVGVWALIAISVKNEPINEIVSNGALIGALIIALAASTHGFINRKKTPFRKEKRF